MLEHAPLLDSLPWCLFARGMLKLVGKTKEDVAFILTAGTCEFATRQQPHCSGVIVADF